MKTILVIEDEATIRGNIAKILSHKGFQAIDAANGTAGIEMAKAYLPDLIVCDIMMPDCDGYAVLDALRHHSTTASIPFIFLSAKVDKPDIRYGMNLGADDYLTKPFTSAELLDAVTARLNRQDAIAQPFATEMKRAAENLNHLAFYDPVTNLPNLILLHRRLHELLETTSQSGGSLIAVSRLRFHRHNAIASKLDGLDDQTIQSIADRLTQFFATEYAEAQKSTTQPTIARLGSQEFGLVLPGLLVEDDVHPFVEQLITALAGLYPSARGNVSLRVQMGVALYPNQGETPSQLLKRAEIAVNDCYFRMSARQVSKYCLYEPTMERSDARRQQLLEDLHHALHRSEFQLYYQPQVNLISERIVGVEALLRWQHPTLGQILPETFVPLAEYTGLLPEIGDWVLQTACAEIAACQPLTLIPLQLSVNLWPQQIQHDGFFSHLFQALQRANLDAKQLVLDISESCLIAFELEAIARLLHDIAATGAQIAVDGFGMQCMPLQHLKRFPIHQLKLDKSFTEHIVEDERDAILTETIISLAQNLKLKVLAKGIETEEQLTELKKHGCHVVQGHLYSAPLPPDELKQLLTTGTPNPPQP